MNPAPAEAPDRDQETVRLLTIKDERGLRRLLEDYGARVQSLLRTEFRSALDESRLEDVMNDAAHRVWRSADTFNPERGTLGGWFYKIARNCVCSTLRKEAQQPSQQVDWELAGLIEHRRATAGTQLQSAYLRALYECIEALPPMQMEIIKADLRTGNIADAAELAARFQTTRNSIYASRSMARRSLREALSERGHGPGAQR